MGNQPIFTAILAPLNDDTPRDKDAKSVMQTEREMLGTIAVPGVMIDEKGSIQGFNEVHSEETIQYLNESQPNTLSRSMRRSSGAGSCRRSLVATSRC